MPSFALRDRKVPYGLNQNSQDVLNALNSNPALEMQAYKSRADYGLARQQAVQQLALAGLQQQSEAQQQQRNLGMQSLRNMMGVVNGALSGLYA